MDQAQPFSVQELPGVQIQKRKNGQSPKRRDSSSVRGLCSTCTLIDWNSLLLDRPDSESTVNIAIREAWFGTDHRPWKHHTSEWKPLSTKFRLFSTLLKPMLQRQTYCSLCHIIVTGIESPLDVSLSHGSDLDMVSIQLGAQNRKTGDQWNSDHPTPFVDRPALGITAWRSRAPKNSPLAAPPTKAYFTLSDDSSGHSEVFLSDNTSKKVALRPLLKSTVDLDTINHWIKACLSHENCSKAPGPPEDIGRHVFILRVIDVDTNCIVLAPENCTYVILSYVWGDSKRVLLLKDELTSEQLTEQVFPFTYSSLPRTFQDAIELTKIIGKKYLWIDALCIMQDDDDERGATIMAMGQVYEDAFLTVICASGRNAAAGLSGIYPDPRRLDKISRTVDGVSLVSCQETKNEREPQTPWATRAWTLQEDLLSKRRLIFAHHRVLFRCKEGVWDEVCPYAKQEQVAMIEASDVSSSRERFDAYDSCVRQLTQRNLSYNNDILNAFCGISSDLERRYGYQFCWGLPIQNFVLALLWDLRNTSSKLERRIEIEPSMGAPFPSWSWAGWIGPISTYYYFEESFEISSEIIWPWQREDPENVPDVHKTGILDIYVECAPILIPMNFDTPGKEQYPIAENEIHLPDGCTKKVKKGVFDCIFLGKFRKVDYRKEDKGELDPFYDAGRWIAIQEGENGIYYKVKTVKDISYSWWKSLNPKVINIKLG